MKAFASLWDGIMRLWRWGDKWLVQIWLGIPLMFGLIGWYGGGLDQYQDLGGYAAKAPRIERNGLIKKAFPKSSGNTFITDDGESIGLTCNYPPDNECVRYITPLRAKVRYFQYRRSNIIIDLVTEDGRHLIKETVEVRNWLKAMKSYQKNTTYDAIIFMAIASLILVIPFMIGIPIIRWIGRRNMKKKGTA